MLDVSGDPLLQSVFHTLAYADIFEYPLTAAEVHRYLATVTASPEEVWRTLTERALFSRDGDYFALRDREYLFEIRRRRARISTRLWPKAIRYGRILASLPFVRMVAVTGSLAMNNTDEGKDIDFMIVTAPGRLWTCRALSLVVARLAKLEGVSLCPNYLVTTRALELRERSLYVAHELAQMVPLSGLELYEQIRGLNAWSDDYLPNARSAPIAFPQARQEARRLFLQRALEIVFGLPLWNRLERWEMHRKMERLGREQASSLESHFSADICKGHVDEHGERIEAALAIRLRAAPDPQGVS